MPDVKSIAYKAGLLLELINRLQLGMVNFEEFAKEFNLTRQQRSNYLKNLIDMKLDIECGERYRRTPNIYLNSDRNIKKAIEVLELKSKLVKVALNKVNESIELNKGDIFSEENLKAIINNLDGSNKLRKQVIAELEVYTLAKTVEEKLKIGKVYELWRSEYLKVNT